MKKIIFLLLLLVIIYLNRSYAYFYDYRKTHPAAPAAHPTSITFTGNSNSAVKLVTMGDSLMFGEGSSDYKKSLPYLLARDFDKKDSVTLVNLASPGANVESVLVNQLPQAIKERPDYVMVLIGINDIHNLGSIKDFKNRYSGLLGMLETETGAKITLINIPALGSNRILLPPWNGLLSLRTDQFNDTLKQLGRGKNVKLVDLNGQLKGQFEKSSGFYSPDQFHPSDLGYGLWATYIDANSDR